MGAGIHLTVHGRHDTADIGARTGGSRANGAARARGRDAGRIDLDGHLRFGLGFRLERPIRRIGIVDRPAQRHFLGEVLVVRSPLGRCLHDIVLARLCAEVLCRGCRCGRGCADQSRRVHAARATSTSRDGCNGGGIVAHLGLDLDFGLGFRLGLEDAGPGDGVFPHAIVGGIERNAGLLHRKALIGLRGTVGIDDRRSADRQAGAHHLGISKPLDTGVEKTARQLRHPRRRRRQRNGGFRVDRRKVAGHGHTRATARGRRRRASSHFGLRFGFAFDFHFDLGVDLDDLIRARRIVEIGRLRTLLDAPRHGRLPVHRGRRGAVHGVGDIAQAVGHAGRGAGHPVDRRRSLRRNRRARTVLAQENVAADRCDRCRQAGTRRGKAELDLRFRFRLHLDLCFRLGTQDRNVRRVDQLVRKGAVPADGPLTHARGPFGQVWVHRGLRRHERIVERNGS